MCNLKIFFLLVFLFFPIRVAAESVCDVEKCNNDCFSIGMELKSCYAPYCIPVCGPLEVPKDIFPASVPKENKLSNLP